MHGSVGKAKNIVSNANKKAEPTTSTNTRPSNVAEKNLNNADPNRNQNTSTNTPTNMPINTPANTPSPGNESKDTDKKESSNNSDILQNVALATYMNEQKAKNPPERDSKDAQNKNYSGAINEFYSKEPPKVDDPNGTSNENMPKEKSNEQIARNSGDNKYIRGAKSLANKTWTGAKKGVKFVEDHQVGGLGEATAVITALATAMAEKSVPDVITAGIGGKALGDSMADIGRTLKESGQNKLDAYMKKRTINNAERDFATAYNKYKKSGNYTDKQMEEQTNKFRNLGEDEISKMKNNDAKAYVRSLHSLPTIYSENGVDDPNKELAETLRKVKEGTIKPREDN